VGEGRRHQPRQGWIEVACIVPSTAEVVVSMRPVCVFANGPDSEIELLRGDLHGRWRQVARLVMIAAGAGLPAA
jgi:hypothetical protein